jgi:hypothetical protein
MAAVARSRCRQMPSRLPAGLNPVVAGHTSPARNTEMFEGSSRPSHSPMATVAGHSCRDMSRRLACRSNLIVTSGTGSRRHAIMGKERGRPICRPMTTAAIDGGWYVIRRFERGHDPPPRRVALNTLSGGSPKNPLKVAALTVDLRMASCERKAGTAMIDFNARAATPLGGRGTRQQQQDAAYSQQSDSSCPGKRSMPCSANHASPSRIGHCVTTARFSGVVLRYLFFRHALMGTLRGCDPQTYSSPVLCADKASDVPLTKETSQASDFLRGV